MKSCSIMQNSHLCSCTVFCLLWSVQKWPERSDAEKDNQVWTWVKSDMRTDNEMLIIVFSFCGTWARLLGSAPSHPSGVAEKQCWRGGYIFLQVSRWFQSQATGVELNGLLKSELQKGYCMPRGSESQQNNAALFSNNECVNGRALTLTVDLLHVCICLTCFWVLNCRPSFLRFPSDPLLPSLMWGPAVS